MAWFKVDIAPTRQPTAQGQIIKFAARPQKSAPPSFKRGHPGVQWHQYLGSLVHPQPLQEPVPAESWACHPTKPIGRVLSRTWYVDGRKSLTRPATPQDDEDIEDAE